MPVCLNCGKSISEGRKYCDECSRVSNETSPHSITIPAVKETTIGKSRGHVWVLVGVIVIFVMLIAALLVLISLFPAEEIKEKQAERCRSRLTLVKKAVEEFRTENGDYPPDGRVNEDHALATNGFIEPPKCPTTGEYYIIEYRDGKVFIICDSDLEGHEI